MAAETMMATGALVFLWSFIAWLSCGIFAGYVASQKSRCVPCWFIWGVLFGPIALISVVGVPALPRQSKQVIGPDGKMMTVRY